MPLTPGLEARFRRSAQNEIFSQKELSALQTQIQTPEDANWVATQLREQLGEDRIELSQYTRRERLDAFLGSLDAKFDLGLAAAPGRDRIDALMMAQGGAKEAEGEAELLPKNAPSGRPIEVTAEGGLRSGGAALDPSGPQWADAVAGLIDPGQLDGIEPAARAALHATVLDGLEASLPLDGESKGKFGAMARIATSAAFLEAEADADALSPEAKQRVGTLIDKAPSAMNKAVLRAAAGQAPAEGDAALLDAHQALAGDRYQVGYARCPRSARTELMALTGFARNGDALDNVAKGLAVFAELDGGRGLGPKGLEAAIAQASTYVDTYPQAEYVFGTFAQEAPKAVAKVTNQALVAELAPGLGAQPPRFGSTPLTSEQAGTMRQVLAKLADSSAAAEIETALARAAEVFSGKSVSAYGRPATPQEALPPAAFALFEKTARRGLDSADATPTGMLDAASLRESLTKALRPLAAQMTGVIGGLRAEAPRLGETRLSPEAAKWMEGLLRERMASTLSLDNLERAVAVYAGSSETLDGEGLKAFQKLIGDYAAQFPDRRQLDFNKLPRIASYAVEGKSMPSSTLDGKPVGLAGLDTAIASSVAEMAKAGGQRYPWMAGRWAFRAREASKLVDVIAQKTAEGTGPVQALRQAHPGKDVSVVVTGAHGAHEEIAFDVAGVGRFLQGSDGKMERSSKRIEPELFTATIGEGGAVHARIAQPRNTDLYLLQTTYSVGDRIDVFAPDRSKSDDWKEGKDFETAHAVREGVIESYDPKGLYTVRVQDGDETKLERVSIKEIAKANNPHEFALDGSHYSDVDINLSQPALAKFIEDAKPIIAEHLPTDGSLYELPTEAIEKRQLACLDALTKFTAGRMKYPAGKDGHPDDASKAYHETIDGLGWYDRAPLGRLLELERGVCRHQFIARHLLTQVAGIDCRIASGAANTASGKYRGLHVWGEVSLAGEGRYLSDQTWNDAAIPLWDGAYDVDARRVEMYHRTARYDGNLVA